MRACVRAIVVRSCNRAIVRAAVHRRGHVVVTVACDGGTRYMSKMYTPSWVAERGLEPQHTDDKSLAWIGE